MQCSLFIKAVKDENSLLIARKEKNLFAVFAGSKEKCTTDPLREISWEHCGVNDVDLTCSFSHWVIWSNHRFCQIRRSIYIRFWPHWSTFPTSIGNFPTVWLYRGLNLSCQFDLPSHLVSGFSTQLTVNISPFCPRLFILRTYLTMTRIPPCYSDRASRDRGMSRQKQAQTLELSEARDTLCAIHPPCLCCIKWGVLGKLWNLCTQFLYSVQPVDIPHPGR